MSKFLSYLGHALSPKPTITGNADDQSKEIAVKWLNIFHGDATELKGLFVDEVAHQFKVTDVSVFEEEVRVIVEVTVTQDMTDHTGHLHNGLTMLLIDECSTLPLAVVAYRTRGLFKSNPGVSLTIDTVFHSLAPLDTHLRIINTAMTLDDDSMSTRSEIWNIDANRLVASGVQTKMMGGLPRPATAASKL